jgi:tetratricopeptide (TPR) repeat protein
VYRQAIILGEKLTAAYPDFANYEINLAGSYGNLGNVVRDQGNPAEALNWYGKAITSLTAVRAANRQFEDARLYLRNAHWDRANALGRLGRHGEAIDDWQRAIGLDEGRDRESLLLFLEAAKTEQQLKKQVKPANAGTAPGLLYDAACVLAQAAGAAGTSNEPSLQKHYASRALALLREAQAAGLFHDGKRIEQLKKDQALLALRQDSAYQKFVAELVAGMKQ